MALWTPANTSVRLWLDCDDASTLYDADTGGSLTADGNPVGRIEDKSGNAYHATESNSGLRPVRSGSTVVFTADRLQIPTSAFVLGDLVIGVFNSSATFTTSSSAGFLNINSSPNDDPELRWGSGGVGDDGDFIRFYYNSNYAITGDYNARDSAVYSASFVAGITATLWKNGTQQATGTRSGSWSAINEFTIGYYTRINASRNGTLNELIVGLTSDREILEGYLAWKWGLEANLPVSHPYKNAAPSTGIARPRINGGLLNNGLINRGLIR